MYSHGLVKVLIADDDPDACEVLQTFLGIQGYQTSIASNGEELLALLRATSPPFVVVLDLRMPRMSGYEVIESLERDGIRRHVPIIVLSAHDVFFGRTFPDLHCLQKPVRLERLIDEIQALEERAISSKAPLAKYQKRFRRSSSG